MTIPRSFFDTRKLPAGPAWDLWHDQISVIFDSRPHKRIEEGFFASVDAWLVGEVGIGHIHGGGQRFDRSRKKIAKDAMDGYVLQFYLQGQSEGRVSGQTAKPGDLYLIDMAQALATTTTDHEQISFALPRRMLAPFLKMPDNCHELVIPGQQPLVTLLRDAMVSYTRNLDRMRADDAEAALKPLVDLTAVAINSELSEEKAEAVNLMLTASIRRHIEANLLDPDLSAETVAGSFGLSRRSLYRLFERFGGFQSYVHERRLRRAWEALRAADQRHLPISAIADSHGFANPENFTRAFRRLFGMTPREVRHLSASDMERAMAATPQAMWSQWVAKIGS
ncbi:AraC-like DNA-binding protein [Rhizobium sp. SG_E_25_P2]|jgi:AraC-like DNA-binding protein|uniref:helix-turn-helix domain-containing protein n=1 Tax=Rhizobium sp. SG_E_25_P2 TaxID=2879942 RepID=UPI0024738308|nr:helix-turn-helix domain-containing protein [Rhizobium sp. SG_E_25_P2]MDH6267464.1 AraC-like DNA-binding protein [Rhizobium sp. SG_E_25_P2]